jgi:hypothetical protein
MRRLTRWYGASPLHLLSFLACFALAGYAAAQLVPSRPLGVVAWFLGAVIGHDLLLMPLYSLADRSVMAAVRHRPLRLPVVPWINYVRVPAALSGLLLLIWFPLIFRLPPSFQATTTLSEDPYVWHWLAVTGALFLLSAVAFALRLRTSRSSAPPECPAVVRDDAGSVDESGNSASIGQHDRPGRDGRNSPPVLEEKGTTEAPAGERERAAECRVQSVHAPADHERQAGKDQERHDAGHRPDDPV